MWSPGKEVFRRFSTIFTAKVAPLRRCEPSRRSVVGEGDLVREGVFPAAKKQDDFMLPSEAATSFSGETSS